MTVLGIVDVFHCSHKYAAASKLFYLCVYFFFLPAIAEDAGELPPSFTTEVSLEL